MTRECDVLGQLDSESTFVQTNVSLLEDSDCVYHKDGRFVEVTAGKVEVHIPIGYVVVCQLSTGSPKAHVYWPTDLDHENKICVTEGIAFGLVKLEPLNVVKTTCTQS